MIPVSVKAILKVQGRVLFLRNPREEWELPGGRPEQGESLEEALVREVQEECGLTVLHTRYVGSRSCEVIAGKHVLIVCFWCELGAGDIVLSDEHDRFSWIDLRLARPSNLPPYYWDFCSAADSAETGTRHA
ncbi:NUDIX domain-containing protein [Burkholderia sp. Cy-637]|uniref:NUDIX hydrolase n=1 Tax=Burkholderia sp. Cy-637 TaxID=2608327 RepID=UPI00142482EF|nr:NUDIX domain-containing protein [Burkholderia sp. Cy-637]NIF92158.1 NUDIX domain-containing protein [Burkholderia sp. Cy-637]